MKIASIIVLLISSLSFSSSVLALGPAPLGIAEPDISHEGITFERPAPDYIIQNANAYVIDFVGKDYFNSYISLNDSSKVKYDYNLTYSYNHSNYVYNPAYYQDFYTVVYFYKIPHESVFTRHFSVELNLNGSVSLYRDGPTQPHKFLVTKEQAIGIARQNGIKIPYGSINHVSGACDITKPVLREGDQEKCVRINDWVWEIYDDADQVGRTIMYIDVDTGKILGSSFDSGIRGAQGGGNMRPPGYTDVGISWPLIAAIVILLAIVGVWFIHKKK